MFPIRCPQESQSREHTMDGDLFSNELSKELWNTFLEDLDIPSDSSAHPKVACAAYIRQHQTVARLYSDRMAVLNKATGVWTSTMLSTPLLLQNYSYAVLFDGSLLCCGGINFGRVQSVVNQASKLALDGEVSSLKPMVTARYWHGIAAYGRKVFVFGGRGEFRRLLLTIEQYDESSWSELPTKLNAHHWDFVPTVYKGLIYLCDDLSKPIEVFNSQTLTVDVLATITSPEPGCIAITYYEGRLVVIGVKDVWRWDEERKEIEVIQKTNYLIPPPKMRNVLKGDVLYIITYFIFLMINMKTFRETLIAPPK